MTLRNALGFSAAFHVLVFTAAPFSGWLPQRQPRFEISYLPAPAVSEKPRIAPPPESRAVVPAAPAPLPLPVPRVVPPPEPEPAPVPRPASPPPATQPRMAEIPIAPRPTISSLPDKEFVFLDHKERVRKHLKARLNYPSFLCAEARGGASSSAGRGDGTVRLRLILGPEGAFRQAVVLETSDPRLADVAVRDAQAAAPYPRLPAKVRPRQLRYEFLVRYKPE